MAKSMSQVRDPPAILVNSRKYIIKMREVIVVWDRKARSALIINVAVPNDFGINRNNTAKQVQAHLLFPNNI